MRCFVVAKFERKNGVSRFAYMIDGFGAADEHEALHIANTLHKVEGTDTLHVRESTERYARIYGVRAMKQAAAFYELMHALMETEPNGHGSV